MLPPPPPPPPEDAVKGGEALGECEGVLLPVPAPPEDGVRVAGGEGEGEDERLVVALATVLGVELRVAPQGGGVGVGTQGDTVLSPVAVLQGEEVVLVE